MAGEIIERHLRGCPACASWPADVEALHAMVRLRTADRVPDLTGSILTAMLVPRPAVTDAGDTGA